MPISHILDTSVYCQPLKPRPHPAVEQRWRALGDAALAISVICEAELLYGLELKKSLRLNDLYDELLRDRLPIIPIDIAVGKAFSVIKAGCRKKGVVTSDFDFLVAATAKCHGLVLATLNIRDFQSIEGLAVEDWSSS